MASVGVNIACKTLPCNSVQLGLPPRLADPAAIERFIAEVRGNPATGHMGRDQLTAFTVWKLELEEQRSLMRSSQK